MKKIVSVVLFSVFVSCSLYAQYDMVRVVPIAQDPQDKEWKILLGLDTDPNNREWSDFNAKFTPGWFFWEKAEDLAKNQAKEILSAQTNELYKFFKTYQFYVKGLNKDIIYFIQVPFISAEIINKGKGALIPSAKNQFRDNFNWVAVKDIVGAIGDVSVWPIGIGATAAIKIKSDVLQMLKTLLPNVITEQFKLQKALENLKDKLNALTTQLSS